MSQPLLSTEARADIQGFITSGYGHLPLAEYLFLHVADAAATRRWIADLAASIATSAPWPRTADGALIKPASAVNVAFTAEGLAAVGLPAEMLHTFPQEFQEGIASPARSRILGDTEESAPGTWEVGSPSGDPVHAVVVIHARDQATLDAVAAGERARVARTNGGLAVCAGAPQHGYRPATDAEPFGFRDGVVQPAIAGIAGEGVPTGEFILGYPNHYGVIPPAPVVPAGLDPQGLLPVLDNPYHETNRWRDLGRHGSFVVYRKLQQDVARFWRTLRDEALRRKGTPDPAYMVWLAAKMVGRWPSGAPLVETPDRDDPERALMDAFEYGGDPDGVSCPVGSHIRRTNPRDDLKPYPAEQSRHMTEAHRLLRRARVFGTPLFDPAILRDDAAPADRARLAALEDDGEVRGIHFFSVNASIRSQFEFVQQNWCNNPRFGGLAANKDPLTGDHARSGEEPTRMTIPQPAGGFRTGPLPRIVTVRGGAYLFMPGISALRFLGGGSFA